MDVLPSIISDYLKQSILVIKVDNNGILVSQGYNNDYGPGRMVILKSEHYWRTELIYSDKIKQDSGKMSYNKPTVVLDSVDRIVDKKVEKEVRKVYNDCNISFKSTKVYDLTKSQTNKHVGTMSQSTAGVIYNLRCKDCAGLGIEANYIGETGRPLAERLREHFGKLSNRTRLTEIGQHNLDVHDSFGKKRWEVSIVDVESREFERKVKESLWIDYKKPQLNKNKGIGVFGSDYVKINYKQKASVLDFS